jgi:hypothetical protein
MMIVHLVVAVSIAMTARLVVPVVMTTGRHVVAVSIAMTVRHVVRVAMTTVRHVAHAAMMIVHLVVAVSIVMIVHLVVPVAMTTGRHVVAVSIAMTTGHLVVAVSIAMTVHLVVRVAITTGHLVVAVSIAMTARLVVPVAMTTGHLVVAVLIVTTVRAAKIRAQQHSVALMKSACEPVDVEQQARCLVHQTAPAKSGLMKVPRGQRVVPQVFVQRQRGVHKKAAAGKFAHSTAWWKSLSAPSVRVHQFAL